MTNINARNAFLSNQAKEKYDVFNEHIQLVKNQSNYLRYVKENLKEEEMLVIFDFSTVHEFSRVKVNQKRKKEKRKKKRKKRKKRKKKKRKKEKKEKDAFCFTKATT